MTLAAGQEVVSFDRSTTVEDRFSFRLLSLEFGSLSVKFVGISCVWSVPNVEDHVWLVTSFKIRNHFVDILSIGREVGIFDRSVTVEDRCCLASY